MNKESTRFDRVQCTAREDTFEEKVCEVRQVSILIIITPPPSFLNLLIPLDQSTNAVNKRMMARVCLGR